MPPLLLTPTEAAEELAISVKTLRYLTNAGRIRYVDVGAGLTRETRRYRLEDLADFAESATRRANLIGNATMNVQALGKPKGVEGEDVQRFLAIIDEPKVIRARSTADVKRRRAEQLEAKKARKKKGGP